MIQKASLLRVVSYFLILNILQSIFAPTLAMALSVGAVSPEYSSFEPVDASDMVNVLSGDASYNIPLFEVPGPEGGYPLSLFYHSNIKVNEDASWVGLGWNLNAGAINRSVVGYPDDYNGVERKLKEDLGSGTTHQVTLGVGVGNFSVDAHIAFDSFQGVGTGFSANLSFHNLVDVSFTSSPYTGSHSIGALGHNVPINSIRNMTPTTTVAGMAVADYQSNSGNLNIESQFVIPTMRIPIPGTPLSGRVGYRYMRYNYINTENFSAFGSLYMTEKRDGNLYGGDTRHLANPDTYTTGQSLYESYFGSILDTDAYFVSAQGLGGTIRPYSYHNTELYRKNVIQDGENLVSYLNTGAVDVGDPRKQFRFSGDFSNTLYYATKPAITNIQNGQFISGTQIRGLGTGESGYDDTKEYLEGSRHIEYYSLYDASVVTQTRRQLILPVSREEYQSQYFWDEYTGTMEDLIAGFAITNSSGVTYHYSVPVYGYDEFMYNAKDITTPAGGNYTQYSQREHDHPYAYTWLLTAITGPDYVPANTDGTISNNDLGYWVKFEYGKWADSHHWRNPITDDHPDLDPKRYFHSGGTKELYYLNSISTRTHTALFEKEIRLDGKGYSRLEIDDASLYPEQGNTIICSFNEGGDQTKIHNLPVSTLRLNNIYLVKNSLLEELLEEKSISDLAANSTTYDHFNSSYSGNGTICTSSIKQIHYGSNVIDKFDISGIREDLESISSKIMSFDFDYSLVPGTQNSYFCNYSNPDASANFIIPETSGKLTLNSIQVKGKNASTLVPPISFDYDIEDSTPQSVSFYFDTNDNRYYIKDIGKNISEGEVRFLTQNGQKIYFYVEEEHIARIGSSNDDFHFVQLLGLENIFSNQFPSSSTIFQSFKTKNPPFDPWRQDEWGHYKPNTDAFRDDLNGVTKFHDIFSAQNQDVWSLRKITSPLGSEITIDYEPDEYRQPALYNASRANLSSISRISSSQVKLFIPRKSDLRAVSIGQSLTVKGLVAHPYTEYTYAVPDGGANCSGFNCDGVRRSFASENIEYSGVISSLVYNTSTDVWEVIINSSQLSAYLNTTKPDESNIDTGDMCTSECMLYADVSYSPPVFISGLITGLEVKNFGGGTRVQGISIYDPISQVIQRTDYDYDGAVSTSGSLGYEPHNLNTGIYYWDNLPLSNQDVSLYSDVEEEFDSYLNSSEINKLLALSSFLPGPEVMYGEVTVSSKTIHPNADVFDHPTKTKLFFQTYNDEMLRYDELQTSVNSWTANSNIYSGMAKTVTIQDFTSQVGVLKKKVILNNDNVPIQTIEHTYLSDQYSDSDSFIAGIKTQHLGQGIVSETFIENRSVKNPYVATQNYYHVYGTALVVESYPNPYIGSKTVNHVLGLATESYTKSFDFFSGQILERYFQDNKGNQYLQYSLPAYLQYSEMGLMSESVRNTHQLTNPWLSVRFRLDENGDESEILNGFLKTWSTTLPVLESDGQIKTSNRDIYHISNLYTIDATKFTEGADGLLVGVLNDLSTNEPPNDGQWFRTESITLYNEYSRALERRLFNGIYDASHWNSNQSELVAKATKCNYQEFVSWDMEENNPNLIGAGIFDFTNSGGQRASRLDYSSAFAHTGDYSYYFDNASTSKKAFTWTSKANAIDSKRGYKVSFWAWSNGSPDDFEVKYTWLNAAESSVFSSNGQFYSGRWQFVSVNIPPSSMVSDVLQVTIQKKSNTSGGAIDDFRLYPSTAAITTFVHNSFGQVEYVLDEIGLYTRLEYDALGVPTKRYQEVFNGDSQAVNGGVNPKSEAREIKLSEQTRKYFQSVN